MGPTQYTHRFPNDPDAIAGPRARAGFAAPPVKGPAIRMSAVNVMPINRPDAPAGTLLVYNTA